MPASPVFGRSKALGALAFLAACATSIAACGGPPVVAPAAPPPIMKPSTDPPPPLPSQAEVPAPPVPEPVEVDTSPPESSTSPSPAATPAPAPLERTQDPIEMLTARDVAFLIDYASSEPKQKATATCQKQAEGKPEELGACLSKARDDFLPDVLRFRKDSEKQTSLLVYKRSGSTLRELSVGVVTLTAAPADRVIVKFTGRQKGARPIFRGRPQVEIVVPNDYSIELTDPDLGKLRYDAKVGLVTD